MGCVTFRPSCTTPYHPNVVTSYYLHQKVELTKPEDLPRKLRFITPPPKVKCLSLHPMILLFVPILLAVQSTALSLYNRIYRLSLHANPILPRSHSTSFNPNLIFIFKFLLSMDKTLM
jgi:hypothetical protein